MSSTEDDQTRKTYQKYTREMRIRLIQLVEEERLPTAQAGRRLGIKQTSACRIINSYKKFDRVFQKKSDRYLREKSSILENKSKITTSRQDPQEKPQPVSGPQAQREMVQTRSQVRREASGENQLENVCLGSYQNNTGVQRPFFPFGFQAFNQWRAAEPWGWPYHYYS